MNECTRFYRCTSTSYLLGWKEYIFIQILKKQFKVTQHGGNGYVIHLQYLKKTPIILIFLIRLKAGSALECAHSFVLLLEVLCVGTSDQINTLHGWGILIDKDRSIQLLKAFTQKRGTRSYCMNETISPPGWMFGREVESPSVRSVFMQGSQRVSRSNVITQKPQIFDEIRKQC